MKLIVFFCVLLTISTDLCFSQWSVVNTPVAKNAIPDIKFIASYPDSLIAAVSVNNEIFISTNSGNTWKRTATFNKELKCLEIGNEGIYAGVNGGYIVSFDKGITWTEKILYSNGYTTDFEFIAPTRIFLTSIAQSDTSGVWESTNNGISWVKHKVSNNSNIALMSITKDTSNNLYAYEYLADDLLKSTNFGLTWSYWNTFNNAKKVDCDSQNNFYLLDSYNLLKRNNLGYWPVIIRDVKNFEIDKSNGNLYAIEGNSINSSLYRSVDTGVTWNNIFASETYQLFNDITVLNHEIYVASNKGVFKSVDSLSQWSLCFKYTDRGVVVRDMLQSSTGKKLIASTEGIFSSSDNFRTWDTTSFISNCSQIAEGSDSTLYASNGNLFYSHNGGLNWIQNISLSGIKDLYINNNDQIFAITGDEGAYCWKSTNKGISWTNIYYAWGGSSARCYPFSIKEKNGNNYFSFSFEYPLVERKFYKRLPNNTLISLLSGVDVYNIFFSTNVLYLATSKGVYKSTDEGSSFIIINNGLSELKVNRIISSSDSLLFCITGSSKIHLSVDQLNWTPLDLTGLPHPHINNIAYINNKLYAETDGGLAVYNGQFTNINESNLVNESLAYALSQSYPNPFNLSCVINYAVPTESEVNISVYNLLGECITELPKKVVPSGYHDITFNASELSSGIYFYVLKAKSTNGKNHFVSAKKMILIK